MSTTADPNGAVKVWLTIWRAYQRYHAYSVEGLDNLDSPPGAKLIVGYHGRPLAWDMCMLTVAIYERYGYLPHGIVHRSIDSVPPLGRLADALGFVTADGPEIKEAASKGEHIIVTPGGEREGMRVGERNRVDWGDHMGYLELARTHGLAIVPVASSGADDAYWGIEKPEWLVERAERLVERYPKLKSLSWATWIGVGPLGIFPFSPPFPVRMRQKIGKPMTDLFPEGMYDSAPSPRARTHDEVRRDPVLIEAHYRVQRQVSELLDQL
jgi:1-acyl-sn-glycerol-3-phosphate acyltransferase